MKTPAILCGLIIFISDQFKKIRENYNRKARLRDFSSWCKIFHARARKANISFGEEFSKELFFCYCAGLKPEQIKIIRLKGIEKKGLTVREYLKRYGLTIKSLGPVTYDKIRTSISAAKI